MPLIRNMRLKTAISLVFLVGFFIPTVAACFLTIQYQRQVLTLETANDHARTLEVLALGLQESVWVMVPEKGIPLVKAVMTDSRIQRIRVDSQEQGFFIRQTREGIIQGSHIQTMKQPIIYNGKVIGEVAMDIDTSTMEAVLARQQARYLLISLGPFLLSAGILFWVLSKKVLKPVERLLHQSENLARKKLDQAFHWDQADEMGALGKSFERTRKALSALFLELEQTNSQVAGQADELKKGNVKLTAEIAHRKEAEAKLIRHQERLEDIIGQRTAELRKSNRELKQEISDRRRIESERREMEVRLQRAEKMEALGNLAGGVAHDLNNILSGIVSYPDIMLLDMSRDDPMVKPLTMIQKAGERAAAVVQDLLTLARRGITINEIVDLEEVVSNYLESPEYENLMEDKPGVSIETDFNTKGLCVRGSGVHITKAVMNLVSNAAEAIPKAGAIRVRIQPLYNDGSGFMGTVMAKGDLLELSISDTGTGIRSQDLEHVFEPFYTTKIMGKSGSGLGMAVVWGTVKDHNGHVDIKSRVGHGTRVSIYLPAGRYGQAPDAEDMPKGLVPGQGSVLVVDDIEEQRFITVSMLEKIGFRAAAVESGEAALRVLAGHRFDLLVLDMLMEPGIDGLETYHQSLKYNPDQKAVIASGFSKKEHIREVKNNANLSYVKKPFLFKDFQKAIHEVLGRSLKDN